MREKGIVVGADQNQEWLLPLWWKHYSQHNAYPVFFVDFGLSDEGVQWCKGKGECFRLPEVKHLLSNPEGISSSLKTSWQIRYGEDFWFSRSAWLKKPYACLHSPFFLGLWLDLDCQVRGSMQGAFDSLQGEIEVSVIKDRDQDCPFLLPGEVHYNSGVIAFRKEAPILSQWAETIMKYESSLPGDQEFLTRAIYLHQPKLKEISSLYNWYRIWGENEAALVYHYCGGLGKIELLQQVDPEEKLQPPRNLKIEF